MKYSEHAQMRQVFLDNLGQLEFDEVVRVGLNPDSLVGLFLPHQAEVLVRFCKRNPSYHIISQLSGRCVNRFVETAILFSLGDGDSNPQLEFEDVPLTKSAFIEIRDSVLQIPVERRTGSHRFALAWSQSVLGGANAFDAKVLREFAFVGVGGSRK